MATKAKTKIVTVKTSKAYRRKKHHRKGTTVKTSKPFRVKKHTKRIKIKVAKTTKRKKKRGLP